VTNVMIDAVVVVVGQLAALAALWIRLSMQLRAEQLRCETLLVLTNAMRRDLLHSSWTRSRAGSGHE
jgi:hypothetical protein